MKRTSLFPKIDREVLLEAAKLSNAEARFLVSDYYDAQDARKRFDMQQRHLGAKADVSPMKTVLLSRMANSYATMEEEFRKALGHYSDGTVIGQWLKSFQGIGPVIAAGFLAHLDIEQAPTAGHYWQYAGLNPLRRNWTKGEKRPYNAHVKQIVFHAGECFKRIEKASITDDPEYFYCRFYREEKIKLEAYNEAGHYAERAKTFVLKKADGPASKALKQGKLPAFNIDRQACNHTVKMLLSHLHAVMYWDYHKKIPPRPYMIAIKGHAHEVKVPNTKKFFPGFAEAYYGPSPMLQAAE